MTIYSLSQFGTSLFFHVQFCCFLTCIQISQEAGQVVWYSHLFQNFPQFVVICIVKGFSVVSEAEVDVFLERSCFFDDPADVGNLISGSSVFSKSSLNIWKFMVHLLLKPGLENFEHYFCLCVWCSIFIFIFIQNKVEYFIIMMSLFMFSSIFSWRLSYPILILLFQLCYAVSLIYFSTQ